MIVTLSIALKEEACQAVTYLRTFELVGCSKRDLPRSLNKASYFPKNCDRFDIFYRQAKNRRQGTIITDKP